MIVQIVGSKLYNQSITRNVDYVKHVYILLYYRWSFITRKRTGVLISP